MKALLHVSGSYCRAVTTRVGQLLAKRGGFFERF
jgi:hypothetical protein